MRIATSWLVIAIISTMLKHLKHLFVGSFTEAMQEQSCYLTYAQKPFEMNSYLTMQHWKLI